MYSSFTFSIPIKNKQEKNKQKIIKENMDETWWSPDMVKQTCKPEFQWTRQEDSDFKLH